MNTYFNDVLNLNEDYKDICTEEKGACIFNANCLEAVEYFRYKGASPLPSFLLDDGVGGSFTVEDFATFLTYFKQG